MGLCSSCSDDADVKRKEKAELRGPLESRSCTDLIWLLVFIVFWVRHSCVLDM